MWLVCTIIGLFCLFAATHFLAEDNDSVKGRLILLLGLINFIISLSIILPLGA